MQFYQSRSTGSEDPENQHTIYCENILRKRGQTNSWNAENKQ